MDIYIHRRTGPQLVISWLQMPLIPIFLQEPDLTNTDGDYDGSVNTNSIEFLLNPVIIKIPTIIM